MLPNRFRRVIRTRREEATRTRDDFFPKKAIEPDTITGLDQIVKDAVELKFTASQLTKEQLTELIQIPPR